MPFPSSRVIPAGWAGHHRPVTASTHTAACTISTGSRGGWTPDAGPTPGITTPVYAGPCRVQPLNSGANAVDAAGQLVIERPYLVAITHDAPDVPVNARVQVTACPDDPHLVGKTLTVVDPRYASLRFERHLVCDLDLTNQA